MSDDKQSTFLAINRETLVPLGLLAGVVLSAITATVWLQGTLLGLKGQIEVLGERISTLQTSGSDRWTATEMHAWSELLAARNPTMHVPPVPGRKE